MIYCSQCGNENREINTYCNKCGSTLIKPEYFNIQTYSDFSQLFTNENKKILNELSFSVNAYNTIIENIKEEGRANYNKLLEDIQYAEQQRMDILSKIKLIKSTIAKITYKSRGAELGSYSFNLIHIDDRLDKANQISTLIHELTHHLVAEIFEQAAMYLLEVKKSEVIEAFVWLVLLGSPTAVLMDEYCAHTVEGRFVPHGYQNFGSFNNVLNQSFDPEKEEDRKIVQTQLVFGNSLAADIIELLEGFITPQLREEIKAQYKKDFNFPPKYDQIVCETKDTLPYQVKASLINIMLVSSFETAQEVDVNEILNDFKKNFTIVNKGL